MKSRLMIFVVVLMAALATSVQAQKGNKDGWLTPTQIVDIRQILAGDVRPLKRKLFDEWKRWEPDSLPTTRTLLAQMAEEGDWSFVVASPPDQFGRYHLRNQRKRIMVEIGIDLFGKHPVIVINFVNHWQDRYHPTNKVGEFLQICPIADHDKPVTLWVARFIQKINCYFSATHSS